MEPAFKAVKHGEDARCGAVLLEVGPGFRGVTRVKCHKCGRRVMVTGDAAGVVAVAMEDRPQVRVPFVVPCCGG